MIYYICLLLMTMMGSLASIFFKRASRANSFIELLVNVNIYIGGCLYVVSAVLNIFILRHLEYSVVLPLTSITYVWTMIFANRIFKEKISVRKILGVTFILVGVFFIAYN